MSEWISVEEKLPEKNATVDIFVDGKRYADCYHMGDLDVFRSKRTGYKRPTSRVTHWMYSPEPPR